MGTRRNIILYGGIALAVVLVLAIVLLLSRMGSNVSTPENQTGASEGSLSGAQTSTSAWANQGASSSLGSQGGGTNGFVTPSGGSGGGSALSSTVITITPRLVGGGEKTYQAPSFQSDSRGDHLLSNSALYDIVYFPGSSGGSFLITLKNSNLHLTEQEAEAYFLALLHIDKPTACTLTVSEKVPYNVDPVASSFDYGLSFCAGSTPLPRQ